jgi:hypothetical protein
MAEAARRHPNREVRPHEIVGALSFALRYDGRNRVYSPTKSYPKELAL